MSRQSWTESLSAANRGLGRDGVSLMGQPVVLKVRSRPSADGSRAIDVFGLFDGAARVVSRSTGVSLTPGNYEVRIPEAIQEAKRLVELARSGQDTRSPRGWSPHVLLPPEGALKHQMQEVQRFLISRSENLGRCRERQLREQLRWMAICEQRALQERRELSMGLCLRALRDHYAGVDRSAYRKAASIVRLVCRHLQLPDQIPDELLPRHRPELPPRDIPPDDVICERLKAIADPYEAQLIYAVVVYGRRVAEVYYADWEALQPDGDLPVYASKNGKRGMSWPVPFGDEQISLEGFRPPLWDQLASVDRRPDPQKEKAINAQSCRITRLIQARLGCKATDLRHRWAIACLVDPRYQEDSMEIASAMCTSLYMLEQTYVREMREYRRNRKRRHSLLMQ